MHKEIWARIGNICFFAGLVVFSAAIFTQFQPPWVGVLSAIMLMYGLYFMMPRLVAGNKPFIFFIASIVLGALLGAWGLTFFVSIITVPIMIARMPSKTGMALAYFIFLSMVIVALVLMAWVLVLLSNPKYADGGLAILSLGFVGGLIFLGAIVFFVVYQIMTSKRLDEEPSESIPEK